MTDTRTFHFAVKPGHGLIKLEFMTAHERMESIAQGWLEVDLSLDDLIAYAYARKYGVRP